jgi:hypothetical protein
MSSEGGSKKRAAEYDADELKREHQKEEAAESMTGRFWWLAVLESAG